MRLLGRQTRATLPCRREETPTVRNEDPLPCKREETLLTLQT